MTTTQPAYDSPLAKTRRAQRFLMYLYIVSVIMIFGGLTSAVMVSSAESDWQRFQMPSIFLVNTIVIFISSITLHWAVGAAKRNRMSQVQTGLWITTLLGIAFLFGQILGYQQLVSMGVYLVGNTSGSYLYIITGMHGLHIIGALIASIVLLIKAIRYRLSADKSHGLQNFAIFWHALDFIWIYLFVFLYLLY